MDDWYGGDTFSDTAFSYDDATEEIEALEKPCILAAFVMGVCGVILSLFIYHMQSISPVLRIGAVAALTGGVAVCGATLAAILGGRKPKIEMSSLLFAFLVAVLLFGAGCLFQFLYGLGGGIVTKSIDDYLFVIDDSGSMANSDENGMRVYALQTLLDGMDDAQKVGLVRFNENIIDEIAMQPLTDGHAQKILGVRNKLQDSGGTDIDRALRHALAMKSAGDANRTTMIVLLTDGESGTSIHVDALSRLCNQKNVIISTVELSNAVNGQVLQRIAQRTGGTYYQIRDLGNLAQIYTQVNVIDESRDLIGIRPGRQHASAFYGFLRIVFWLLLGLLAGIGAWIIFSARPKALLLPIVCAVGGGVCGVLLEIYNGLWWQSSFWHFVALLPLCVFIVYHKYTKSRALDVEDDTDGDLSPGSSIYTGGPQHELSGEKPDAGIDRLE